MDALIYIGILFAGLLPGLYMLAQYNALIALRSRVRRTWSELSASLDLRRDVFLRILETASSHASREEGTLEHLATRDHRMSAAARSRQESDLIAALRPIFPRLTTPISADSRLEAIFSQLTKIESEIEGTARIYNETAKIYRRRCETFPSSIVARMFGFQPASPFEAAFALPRQASPH